MAVRAFESIPAISGNVGRSAGVVLSVMVLLSDVGTADSAPGGSRGRSSYRRRSRRLRFLAPDVARDDPAPLDVAEAGLAARLVRRRPGHLHDRLRVERD